MEIPVTGYPPVESSSLSGGSLSAIDDWITINVGGKLFQTCRSTIALDKNCMLAKMLSSDSMWKSRKDENGAYLLDRDPIYFGPILNYLRTAKVIIDPFISVEGVFQEAEYFQIESLIEQLQPANRADLTRKEVVTNRKNLQFAHLRLMSVDFSAMDLSHEIFYKSNLKNATFRTSTIESTVFEMAEASLVNFSMTAAKSANFRNANLKEAQFNFSDLTAANFCAAILESASFEGANCQSALFQRAILVNANFQRSNMKDAKFQYADLKGANFSGAKICGNCHFSRSDLRGANGIDWEQIEKFGAGKAKVTMEQYDAIPLSNERKRALNLKVIEPNLLQADKKTSLKDSSEWPN